jgi:phospholipase C
VGSGHARAKVIISPFAKKGFIDHTIYNTTAILKLIETRFGLEPLGKRDKCSKDMNAAFEFEGWVSAPPDCESKPAAEAKPESAPAPQAQPKPEAEPKP